MRRRHRGNRRLRWTFCVPQPVGAVSRRACCSGCWCSAPPCSGWAFRAVARDRARFPAVLRGAHVLAQHGLLGRSRCPWRSSIRCSALIAAWFAYWWVAGRLLKIPFGKAFSGVDADAGSPPWPWFCTRGERLQGAGRETHPAKRV